MCGGLGGRPGEGPGGCRLRDRHDSSSARQGFSHHESKMLRESHAQLIHQKPVLKKYPQYRHTAAHAQSA